jgi:hypothetical protein
MHGEVYLHSHSGTWIGVENGLCLGEGLDEVYHGVVGIQNYLRNPRNLARSHR